ncbi:DUF6000 family protein [Streptomyces sp. NPDC048462]|uniref:DUF6000 family protein n=1 Tax=Streptomyces sp. NPDC048462 TaxID=3365555 RepID=UPI0037171B75
MVTAYLERKLPHTDLAYAQLATLGGLLRLDAHHIDRFTKPDGLWDQWVQALLHVRDQLGLTPAEQHRWTDLLLPLRQRLVLPVAAAQ